MKKLASILALSVATFSYNANATTGMSDELDLRTTNLRSAVRAVEALADREGDLKAVNAQVTADQKLFERLGNVFSDIVSAAQEATQPPVFVNGMPPMNGAQPTTAPELIARFSAGMSRLMSIVGTSPGMPTETPLDRIAAEIYGAQNYLGAFSSPERPDVQTYVNGLNTLQQLEWPVKSQVNQALASQQVVFGGATPMVEITDRMCNFMPLAGGLDTNGQPINLPPVNFVLHSVKIDGQPYDIMTQMSAQRALMAAQQTRDQLPMRQDQASNALQTIADALSQIATEKVPLIDQVEARLTELNTYVRAAAGLPA